VSEKEGDKIVALAFDRGGPGWRCEFFNYVFYYRTRRQPPASTFFHSSLIHTYPYINIIIISTVFSTYVNEKFLYSLKPRFCGMKLLTLP